MKLACCRKNLPLKKTTDELVLEVGLLGCEAVALLFLGTLGTEDEELL